MKDSDSIPSIRRKNLLNKKKHLLMMIELFVPDKSNENYISIMPNFIDSIRMAESNILKQLRIYEREGKNPEFAKFLRDILNSDAGDFFLRVFPYISSMSSFIFGRKGFILEFFQYSRDISISTVNFVLNERKNWKLPSNVYIEPSKEEISMAKKAVQKVLKNYVIDVWLTGNDKKRALQLRDENKRFLEFVENKMDISQFYQDPILNEKNNEFLIDNSGNVKYSKTKEFFDTTKLKKHFFRALQNSPNKLNEIGLKNKLGASSITINAGNLAFSSIIGYIKQLAFKDIEALESSSKYLSYKHGQKDVPVGMLPEIKEIINAIQTKGPLNVKNLKGITKDDISHSLGNVYLKGLVENSPEIVKLGLEGVCAGYELALDYRGKITKTYFNGYLDLLFRSFDPSKNIPILYTADFKPDLHLSTTDASGDDLSPGTHFINAFPQIMADNLMTLSSIDYELGAKPIVLSSEGAVQFDIVAVYIKLLELMSGKFSFDKEKLIRSFNNKHSSSTKGRLQFEHEIQQYRGIVPDENLLIFFKEFKNIILKLAKNQYGESFSKNLEDEISYCFKKIDENIKKEEIYKIIELNDGKINIGDIFSQSSFSDAKTSAYIEILKNEGRIIETNQGEKAFISLEHVYERAEHLGVFTKDPFIPAQMRDEFSDVESSFSIDDISYFLEVLATSKKIGREKGMGNSYITKEHVFKAIEEYCDDNPDGISFNDLYYSAEGFNDDFRKTDIKNFMNQLIRTERVEFHIIDGIKLYYPDTS